MSLWGNSDKKAQSNTAAATLIVTAANTTVKGVNTKFAADFSVGDVMNVGGNDYILVTVSNNSTMSVVSADAGGSVIGAGSNANYTVSEKPLFVKYSESIGAGGDMGSIFGVSTTEMAFANTAGTERDNITHAGWVRRTEGSGGRAGRVFYETLVAGSSITGDASDDTQLPE